MKKSLEERISYLENLLMVNEADDDKDKSDDSVQNANDAKLNKSISRFINKKELIRMYTNSMNDVTTKLVDAKIKQIANDDAANDNESLMLLLNLIIYKLVDLIYVKP